MPEVLRDIPIPVKTRSESARSVPYYAHLEQWGLVSTQQLIPLRTRSVGRETGQEQLFGKNWLIKEVARVQKEPVVRGESPWWMLSGTGFMVDKQVGQLVRNLSHAPDNAYEKILEAELGKVSTDVKKWEQEYPQVGLGIQQRLEWKEVNGEMKLYCPEYANVTWDSATSKNERDGVVREVLFGDREKGVVGVEEKLRKAAVGTIILVDSPEGWSGMEYTDGQAISFDLSQLYAFQVLPGGKLRALTFRFKAHLGQHLALQESLGLQTPDVTNDRDQIKHIMRNVAVIDPEGNSGNVSGIGSMEDVVNLIQQAVGGRSSAFEGRSFDDMRDYLRNPEEATKRAPESEPLAKGLIDYLRYLCMDTGLSEDSIIKMAIALGITMTAINKAYRLRRERDIEVSAGDFLHDGALFRGGGSEITGNHEGGYSFDYAKERDEMEKNPGCAGGGTTITILSGGFDRRATVGGNGSAKDKMLCVTCPFCSATVNAEKEGSTITCPECHKSATKS